MSDPFLDELNALCAKHGMHVESDGCMWVALNSGDGLYVECDGSDVLWMPGGAKAAAPLADEDFAACAADSPPPLTGRDHF